MLRWTMVMLCAAVAAAPAQAQESRLDSIQKSGVLRVCTPGEIGRAHV